MVVLPYMGYNLISSIKNAAWLASINFLLINFLLFQFYVAKLLPTNLLQSISD